MNLLRLTQHGGRKWEKKLARLLNVKERKYSNASNQIKIMPRFKFLIVDLLSVKKTNKQIMPITFLSL